MALILNLLNIVQNCAILLVTIEMGVWQKKVKHVLFNKPQSTVWAEKLWGMVADLGPKYLSTFLKYLHSYSY